MKNYKLKIFRNLTSVAVIINILLYNTNNASTQTRIASPYSSLGAGNLRYNFYKPNSGMAGLAFAYRDPASINFVNPASFNAFDSLSFVFQTGIISDFYNLSTEKISQNSNYTSFSYLLFGFPVNKWWRASLGFLPYSDVGYNIRENDSIANTGTIDYLFEGEGGFKYFYIGNSFRINNNLSLGFKTSYLFGSINRTQFVRLTDTIYYYYLKQKESTVPGDFLFNPGLQYTFFLNKDLSLTFGLAYTFKTAVNAKKQVISERYIQSGESRNIVDTVAKSGDIKGKIVLPQMAGLGLILEKENKWLAGADLQIQKWSEYRTFNKSDSLADSWQIALGAEWTPDNSSVSKYIQKMRYRMGINYSKTFLQFNGKNIYDFGFSLGVIFPFKRTKTNFSLNLELGQRGTTKNILIKEQYAKMSFCINVYEKWFYKRKYD